MNKIFKFSGFFFIISVLFLIGCRSSVTKWNHLYEAEETAESAADGTQDITIDDETLSTRKEPEKIEDIDDAASSDETAAVETDVWVYVCGAVECPGVYELPAQSRVVDAINAAGGLREDADSLLINQAKIVEDGEQIRIYTKEEAMNMEIPIDIDKIDAAESKVNINKASADDLMTLPGIGEAKADAIISYREEIGAFSKIEDIMNIPGIKEAVFSKIRDRITV